MAKQKGSVKTGGRVSGTPNKVTSAARDAIALFVDGNAHRLQQWLDDIANGKKSDNGEKYITYPDPEKAFSLFQSIIEYHVPKLQRSDLNLGGQPDNPVLTKNTNEITKKSRVLLEKAAQRIKPQKHESLSAK